MTDKDFGRRPKFGPVSKKGSLDSPLNRRPQGRIPRLFLDIPRGPPYYFCEVSCP